METPSVVEVGDYRCSVRATDVDRRSPRLESLDEAMTIADVLAELNQRSDLQVFKASFDKANGTSLTAH